MRHSFTESWKGKGEGGNEEKTKSPEKWEKQKISEFVRDENDEWNEMKRKKLNLKMRRMEDEEKEGCEGVK